MDKAVQAALFLDTVPSLRPLVEGSCLQISDSKYGSLEEKMKLLRTICLLIVLVVCTIAPAFTDAVPFRMKVIAGVVGVVAAFATAELYYTTGKKEERERIRQMLLEENDMLLRDIERAKNAEEDVVVRNMLREQRWFASLLKKI